MISNLIDLLISKTADGNISWSNIPEKWNCEYGRTCTITTRTNNLRLELYYTDSGDDISNAVLLVYDIHTKLSQSTSEEYPNMLLLAKDLFTLQIIKREKVLNEAFRSLSSMPAQERIIPIIEMSPSASPKIITKTKTKIVTKIVEVEKKPQWKKWLIDKLNL